MLIRGKFNSMGKGRIIAAFGIPGSGKSTVSTEMGKQLRADVFHEPEEKCWGEAVSNRATSGNFTAIMWFRSIRVPMIYNAKAKKEQNETVFLDSYYDKLFSLYMDEDGMQWLYGKTDPYYEEMRGIAEKDYKQLPDIDCLVFFYVDKLTWTQFIDKRDRDLDKDDQFRENCFRSQEHFLNAAKQYCKDKECQLIVYDQKFSSPEDAAKEIILELKSIGIINN